MTALTPRQRQILEFIQDAIAANGMPPTRAEIAQALGFRSANAAEEHLRALQRKGVLALMAAERADRPGTQGGETARQVRESRDAVLELAGICRGPADGRTSRFAEYRARLE